MAYYANTMVHKYGNHGNMLYIVFVHETLSYPWYYKSLRYLFMYIDVDLIIVKLVSVILDLAKVLPKTWGSNDIPYDGENFPQWPHLKSWISKTIILFPVNFVNKH